MVVASSILPWSVRDLSLIHCKEKVNSDHGISLPGQTFGGHGFSQASSHGPLTHYCSSELPKGSDPDQSLSVVLYSLYFSI